MGEENVNIDLTPIEVSIVKKALKSYRAYVGLFMKGSLKTDMIESIDSISNKLKENKDG